MRVDQEPTPPMRLCTTLSGQRVHLTVPVGYHALTLCREVVYQEVTADKVRGRQMCQQCQDRRPL